MTQKSIEYRSMTVQLMSQNLPTKMIREMKMSLYCISLDRRNWETVRSARGLNKLLFPYCSILTEELYPTDLLTALCTPEQYDKHKHCAYFAARGYCEETSPYHKPALSNCPASCSNCVSKSEGTCSFIFIFFLFVISLFVA